MILIVRGKSRQLQAALDRIGGADDRWLREERRVAANAGGSESTRRIERRNMRMSSLLDANRLC